MATLLAVLAAGAHALCAAPAAAQPRVTSARFVADLAGPGRAAEVRVAYVLTGVAPGDSVPVTLLDFGLALDGEMRVGAAGARTVVPTALGSARRARLPVEGSAGEARLEVSYRVPLPAGAGAPRVAYLPVLTVDGAPEGARPGRFQAEVRVPGEWALTEAFPTGLGPSGQAGALRGDLAVVPSVVTLRFRAPGGGGVPLPALLNVIAGACLAVVGILGWRQLAPGRP